MWLNAKGPGIGKSWKKGQGPETHCFGTCTYLCVYCMIQVINVLWFSVRVCFDCTWHREKDFKEECHKGTGVHSYMNTSIINIVVG